MSDPMIVTTGLDRELVPAPIEPSWIRSGTPVARNAVLATSADGEAVTILWECSAGEFDWHYRIDETLYILSGSVVLESSDMPATRYGAGDVIFFKYGARAAWRVDDHVRKLSFCRQVRHPLRVRIPRALWRRLRALLPASLVGEPSAEEELATSRGRGP